MSVATILRVTKRKIQTVVDGESDFEVKFAEFRHPGCRREINMLNRSFDFLSQLGHDWHGLWLKFVEDVLASLPGLSKSSGTCTSSENPTFLETNKFEQDQTIQRLYVF